MTKKFQQFYEQLPDTHKQLLDIVKIDNFNILKKFAHDFGVKSDDYNEIMHQLMYEVGFINNLSKVKELFEHLERLMEGTDDPEEEEFFTYDDSIEEEAMDYFEEDDEDSPFAFPKKCRLDREVLEYHIRFKLNNSPIPVWREIKIPSNVTLEFLAFVLIYAMGWENEHLHCYRKKDQVFKNTVCINQDREFDNMFGGLSRSLNTNDFAISDILQNKGDRILFEYDFGDSWEHDVWVKGIRQYEQGEEPQLLFVKGKGVCPPENCGGVGGYAYLLDLAQKKRKTAEEKAQLEYYGMSKLPENMIDICFDGLQEVLNLLWNRAEE